MREVLPIGCGARITNPPRSHRRSTRAKQSRPCFRTSDPYPEHEGQLAPATSLFLAPCALAAAHSRLLLEWEAVFLCAPLLCRCSATPTLAFPRPASPALLIRPPTSLDLKCTGAVCECEHHRLRGGRDIPRVRIPVIIRHSRSIPAGSPIALRASRWCSRKACSRLPLKLLDFHCIPRSWQLTRLLQKILALSCQTGTAGIFQEQHPPDTDPHTAETT